MMTPEQQHPVERYAIEDIITFATQLLHLAGLAQERARIVAEVLVEADLMGHSTHGLQLLAPYLKELERGAMATTGEPDVLADHGAALTWDGKYLPGPWLVRQAMDAAFTRIQTHPVVTVVIQRSHHIACLAAYLQRATERGLLMLLTCSDPSVRSVAPYGGIQAAYTPNPLAAGIPTQGDPILIDISMSCTANGQVARTHQQGKRLPHPWLLDAQGNPTDDPAVFFADPPGTILPLGGMDVGYKGFALGLLMEVLTCALSGYGRAEHPTNWGAAVFLQIMNPDKFGGREVFLRETEWFADTCQNTPVRPGNPPVRLPGSRALEFKREQLKKGLVLDVLILNALKHRAEQTGIPFPDPYRKI